MYMQPKDVRINFLYPSHMHPGEDKFIKNSISISPFKGVLFFEIRCSDIITTSYNNNFDGINSISIEGKDYDQNIPVHFHANSNATSPSRKEFGIFIYKRKCNTKALVLSILLVVLFCLPSIAIAFKLAFLQLNLTVGGVIAVNIPICFLISAIFTSKRLLLILKLIFQQPISINANHSAHGVFDTIEITSEITATNNDNMAFEISL